MDSRVLCLAGFNIFQRMSANHFLCLVATQRFTASDCGHSDEDFDSSLVHCDSDVTVRDHGLRVVPERRFSEQSRLLAVVSLTSEGLLDCFHPQQHPYEQRRSTSTVHMQIQDCQDLVNCWPNLQRKWHRKSLTVSYVKPGLRDEIHVKGRESGAPSGSPHASVQVQTTSI
ncbi:hypothetical protein BC835DRAFT_285411 [Cytidiella melzeri]|nr:hypothetical protein BC835DRAFT_285411 [Cytidiella melzeri]